MHRTGKYKTINSVFGIFPFCGLIFIILLREDSGFIQQWFSIIPIGFGNAVIFQTLLSTSFICISSFRSTSFTATGDSRIAGSFVGYVFLHLKLHGNRNRKADMFVTRPESEMAFGTAFAHLFKGLGERLLANATV